MKVQKISLAANDAEIEKDPPIETLNFEEPKASEEIVSKAVTSRNQTFKKVLHYWRFISK